MPRRARRARARQEEEGGVSFGTLLSLITLLRVCFMIHDFIFHNYFQTSDWLLSAPAAVYFKIRYNCLDTSSLLREEVVEEVLFL